VAILGASPNPTKWGHWLARGALKGTHRRAVYLVNRHGGMILGNSSYRSLDELPAVPELVVITVRATEFEAAVGDAVRAGARAIVAITAGLGEVHASGLAIQRAAIERVRATGAVLVGPNCIGIADTGSELALAFEDFDPGPVGLVSQSGNLGLELARLAREASVGFTRFVSLGNQADLEAVECMEAFIDHEATRVIALYLEDFRDGRAFAATAHAAVEAGKPVVLLTIGRSQASIRAAHSHTGSLISSSAAVDAACRASGAFRVESPQQLIDLVQALMMRCWPRGRRIAVAGDGGGHVALAADRLTAHGLVVESLSDGLVAEVARVLPANAAAQNPIDLAGGAEQDLFNFHRVVRLLAGSGEADAILLTGYFGGYGEQTESFARPELQVAAAMARAADECGRPLVVHTMHPRSAVAVELRRHGVAVYADIEAAARSLGKLVEGALAPPFGLPGAQTAVMESRYRAVGAGLHESYFGTRRLLASAGIPFVEARLARTREEVQAAANELGYPVVLKALGRLHKSEGGGVRQGLASEDGLTKALVEIQAELQPPAFSVERMAPVDQGVELLIGMRRDRKFGPVALVGLGGVYAEVLRDTAMALAPVTPEQGLMLIRSLRSAELLLGTRGRPARDVEAAARALSALSWLAAALPEIAEIEVNPLLVLEHGVVGLDARLVSVGSD
jgi:acyl-CoA synthetase (NDP forming)